MKLPRILNDKWDVEVAVPYRSAFFHRTDKLLFEKETELISLFFHWSILFVIHNIDPGEQELSLMLIALDRL